jgi:uncharacterized membrane protein
MSWFVLCARAWIVNALCRGLVRVAGLGMSAHVTAASVHDFKLFSYFFALFVIFLGINACDFKSFDIYYVSFYPCFLFIHINI